MLGGKLQIWLLVASILCASPARAEPNYRVVGWFNTFVPGGGELLRGHPIFAAVQATLEVGSFWWGYSKSARRPLTLDGVPESLPPVVSRLGKSRAGGLSTGSRLNTALYADWAQEFGIKYHFVNVFNAYRGAARSGGTIGRQKIDQTGTGGLLLAPFTPRYLAEPAVYLGLLATAAALIYNYNAIIHTAGALPQTRPLNPHSQTLYDLTYLGVFPVGSAAPEEMFYRGFLQHEFYAMSRTPFVSVSLSTTAYAFSHSPEDRLSAAVSGLFLGILTHAKGGALSPGIAYHFWADVMSGIYQIALQRKSSGTKPFLDLSFPF